MVIYQHLYTGRGVYKVKVIKDVTKVTPRTVALDFTKYTSVLYINAYPMVFRSSALRDAAYNKIIKESHEVTLELDEFYETKLPDDKIIELLKTRKFELLKSLKYNLDMVLVNNLYDKCEQAKTLPAFELLSTTQFKSIIAGKKTNFTNEQIKRFADTLIFPKEFSDIMRPSDFWNSLYRMHTSKSTKP